MAIPSKLRNSSAEFPRHSRKTFAKKDKTCLGFWGKLPVLPARRGGAAAHRQNQHTAFQSSKPAYLSEPANETMVSAHGTFLYIPAQGERPVAFSGSESITII